MNTKETLCKACLIGCPSPEASGIGATRSVPATFGINQEDFFIIAEAMHAAIQ